MTIIFEAKHLRVADTAVVRPSRFGDNTLLTNGHCWNITLFLKYKWIKHNVTVP